MRALLLALIALSLFGEQMPDPLAVINWIDADAEGAAPAGMDGPAIVREKIIPPKADDKGAFDIAQIRGYLNKVHASDARSSLESIALYRLLGKPESSERRLNVLRWSYRAKAFSLSPSPSDPTIDVKIYGRLYVDWTKESTQSGLIPNIKLTFEPYGEPGK